MRFVKLLAELTACICTRAAHSVFVCVCLRYELMQECWCCVLMFWWSPWCSGEICWCCCQYVCVCVCLNESEHFYLNDDILMTCCCKRAHENECVCVSFCSTELAERENICHTRLKFNLWRIINIMMETTSQWPPRACVCFLDICQYIRCVWAPQTVTGGD